MLNYRDLTGRRTRFAFITRTNPAEVHSLAYYFDHQPEMREIEEEQQMIEEAERNAKPSAAEQRSVLKGCCRIPLFLC